MGALGAVRLAWYRQYVPVPLLFRDLRANKSEGDNGLVRLFDTLTMRGPNAFDRLRELAVA